MDWSLGSQGIHILDRSVQDMRVEKENGVERLVLSAGGYLMPTGKIREELFQLFVTRERVGHLVDGRHVTAQPKDIALFRGKGLVAAGPASSGGLLGPCSCSGASLQAV